MPDRVRKRIEANSLMVADGLEKLQQGLLDLFNARLDQYRDQMLERDDRHLAMLQSLTDEVVGLRQEFLAFQSGLEGLSVQLAEYESVASVEERRAAMQMVHDHERRLSGLEDTSDARHTSDSSSTP